MSKVDDMLYGGKKRRKKKRQEIDELGSIEVEKRRSDLCV